VPGDLGPEPEADALVGLDAEDQGVRLELGHLVGGDGEMRRSPELEDDLRHPLGQALPGAYVERHAGPPPVVDVEPQCHERLHQAQRIDARLLAVPGHQLGRRAAPRVLAAHRDPVDVGALG
jgi:hypothetical protein